MNPLILIPHVIGIGTIRAGRWTGRQIKGFFEATTGIKLNDRDADEQNREVDREVRGGSRR